MFDSPSPKRNAGPFAWMRGLFSRTAADARLSELARARKLPPIAEVVDRAGREPLPPD